MTPGERAVQRLMDEWIIGVAEQPGEHGFDRIDRYIRGAEGLGWGSVEVGPGARPRIAYHANGAYQWCGAAAAYAWAETIPLKVRRSCFSSTVRLWEWAHGTREPGTFGGQWQLVEPGLPLKWEPEPGDVCIVERGDGGRVWGDHVTVCRERGSVDGVIRTVEGNATGTIPSGVVPDGRGGWKTWAEGVVLRERHLPGRQPPGVKGFVRWILRPVLA